MPAVHIITYGKNQTPKRPHWWDRKKSVYRIRCDKALRRFTPMTESTTGLDECVKEFYEKDLPTTKFLFDTFIKVHDWVHEHDAHELYIYVKSNRGIVRSVYIGEMCRMLLVSIGYEVEIHHLELMRRNLQ